MSFYYNLHQSDFYYYYLILSGFTMYFLEILTMLLFGALVGAAPQAGIPNVDVHVRWSLLVSPFYEYDLLILVSILVTFEYTREP